MIAATDRKASGFPDVAGRAIVAGERIPAAAIAPASQVRRDGSEMTTGYLIIRDSKKINIQNGFNQGISITPVDRNSAQFSRRLSPDLPRIHRPEPDAVPCPIVAASPSQNPAPDDQR